MFLDRAAAFFFFQVALQLYWRGWVDPVPDPLLLRKSGSAGNRILTNRPQRRSLFLTYCEHSCVPDLPGEHCTVVTERLRQRSSFRFDAAQYVISRRNILCPSSGETYAKQQKQLSISSVMRVGVARLRKRRSTSTRIHGVMFQKILCSWSSVFIRRVRVVLRQSASSSWCRAPFGEQTRFQMSCRVPWTGLSFAVQSRIGQSCAGSSVSSEVEAKFRRVSWCRTPAWN
jgi:hypothetical protein